MERMPCAYFEGKNRAMKAKKEREGLLFQRMSLRSLWSFKKMLPGEKRKAFIL
jgi:hypothetical protein